MALVTQYDAGPTGTMRLRDEFNCRSLNPPDGRAARTASGRAGHAAVGYQAALNTPPGR